MSPSSGADATMRQPPTPLSTSIYLCLQQPHVCSNAEDEPRWFDGQLKANEVIVWANIEQFKFNRYSKDQLKDILLQILQDMDSKEDTSRASAGNKVSVPAPAPAPVPACCYCSCCCFHTCGIWHPAGCLAAWQSSYSSLVHCCSCWCCCSHSASCCCFCCCPCCPCCPGPAHHKDPDSLAETAAA